MKQLIAGLILSSGLAQAGTTITTTETGITLKPDNAATKDDLQEAVKGLATKADITALSFKIEQLGKTGTTPVTPAPTPTPVTPVPPAPEVPSFTTSTTVTPTSVKAGETVKITATFKAKVAASTMNVNLEVRPEGESSRSLGQQMNRAQSFGAGETKTYTWNFVIPEGFSGSYCVVNAVSEQTFTTWHTWNSCVAKFSVTAPPVVAPTPGPVTPPPPAGSRTVEFGANMAGAEFGDPADGRPAGTGYFHFEAWPLDLIKSKGMSLIRFPIKWERVQKQLNGPLDATEVSNIKGSLDMAHAKGFRVMLDVHNYGERYVNGKKPHIGESPDLTVGHFADLWSKLAAQFKDHPAIYAWDIMNEPQGFAKGESWPNAAQAAVDAIRKIDTKHEVHIEGDCWAGAHSWQSCNGSLDIKDPANNLVYHAHQYFDANNSGNYDGKSYDGEKAYPMAGADRLKGFVAWLKTRNARGFIGELGTPNTDSRWNVVLENTLQYMKDNCLSGTYWAAGAHWGQDIMTLTPENAGGSIRPQMQVAEKFSRPTVCK